MTGIIRKFATVKKQRGDVLNPVQFRSIVEMIRGIVREQDSAGFNVSYLQLLDHIADFDDPHKVTESSFFTEIVDEVYAKYIHMLDTPLTREEFDLEILPTTAFWELCKRIVLNAFLYDMVRDPDGKVQQNVSATLGAEWGYSDVTVVSMDFGRVVPDFDEFLRHGWDSALDIVPTVFNANDLRSGVYLGKVLFHVSQTAPYDSANLSGFGYPIDISGSSNDLFLAATLANTPTVDTTVFSFLNVSDTLEVVVDVEKQISVKFNGVPAIVDIPCDNGFFTLEISRTGVISLTTQGNFASETLDFTEVVPFTLGLVGISLYKPPSSVFSLKDLTVYKTEVAEAPEPTITPIMFYLPPSGITPLTGSTNGSSVSLPFSAKEGYNLYLTLLGVWTGKVTVERSILGEAPWSPITTHGGELVGEHTSNCDEVVLKVNSPDVRFRLRFAITSGAVYYRLAQ